MNTNSNSDPFLIASENQKKIVEELVPVIDALLIDYTLPLFGDHGVAHWARVLENGIRLTQRAGGNLRIVSLFAVLHDAKRINECSDPEHGPRAADFARELQGTLYELSPRELILLDQACRYHTTGKSHEDITVRICWDSDRLDLSRVGITPEPTKLCTEEARNPELLTWADDRAFLGFVPPFVYEIWGLPKPNP